MSKGYTRNAHAQDALNLMLPDIFVMQFIYAQLGTRF